MLIPIDGYKHATQPIRGNGRRHKGNQKVGRAVPAVYSMNLWKILLISIYFLFLSGVEEVYSADDRPPQFFQQSQDKRINELYRYYQADARRSHAQPDTPAFSDLPDVLQAMIDQGQTSLLDELLNRAQKILFQQVWSYDLPMDFFVGSRENPPAEQIAALLVQAEISGQITDGALVDIIAYLDGYSGEDWYERFGATGLYSHLRELQRNNTLVRGAWWYYRGRLSHYAVDPDIALKSIEQKDLISALKKSYHQLSSLINSGSQNQSASAHIQLKQVMLARVLGEYEVSYLQNAQNQLSSLKKMPLDIELTCQLKVESLRCSFKRDKSSLSVIKQSLQEVAELNDWLNDNQTKLENFDTKKLQLALWESCLLQHRQRLLSPRSVPPEQLYLTNRRFLEPLIRLGEQTEKLRPVIQELAGARLAVVLGDRIHSDDDVYVDGLLRNWNDFELLALARYFQNRESPSYELSLRVYRYFIEHQSDENKNYPQVLFSVGFCHYRQGLSQEPQLVTATGARHVVAAVKYWHQLAREYPQWISGDHPQQINAAHAAEQAVTLAYNLFVQNPQQYTEIALEVLPTFVGRIESGKTQPVGPYADTEAARKFRYHYAYILQTAQKYEQAADMYAAVPDEDTNKTAARYYALFSRLQPYLQDDTKAEQRMHVYPTMIKELNQFIDNHPGNPLTGQAIFLMVQIYQQLDQIEPALRYAHRALRVDSGNRRLQVLCLNLLNQQRPTFLKLHARGEHRELMQLLSVSLPLAQATFNSFIGADPNNIEAELSDEHFSLVARALAEQLCLAAVTSIEDTSKTAPEVKSGDSSPFHDNAMVEQLLNHLGQDKAISSQLWYVRCQAQLSFARGEYVEAQKLWYQIRGATRNAQDDDKAYFWWEARYFGLRCLLQTGNPQEVIHVIDVLLQSRPDAKSAWIVRLHELKEQARNLSEK
jgi:hypothetical protein